MVPITNIIGLVLIIFSNVIPGECSSSPLADAFYVFGDSLVDNGNNNWRVTVARVHYPPYGHNFSSGHCPTGRFTNGKTVADFTADYLELPYPPPYENPFNRKSLTGYNYASGSCGILPYTGRQHGLCLNLDEQISLFEETRRTILSPRLQNKVSEHLAKSIFLVVVGSNDYISNYFGSFFDTSQRYDATKFAQLLLDSLSQQLQKLYQLGARKVMVSNIGPLGCLPSVVKDSKPGGKCDEKKNEIVSIYNTQFPFMLNNLTSNLTDSHFVLIESYNLVYDAIINPINYGFSDSSNSCCVTGGKVAGLCVPGLPPCQNPSSHFFWDDVHPTEAVYSKSASYFIHGSSGSFPKNLKELLQA